MSLAVASPNFGFGFRPGVPGSLRFCDEQTLLFPQGQNEKFYLINRQKCINQKQPRLSLVLRIFNSLANFYWGSIFWFDKKS